MEKMKLLTVFLLCLGISGIAWSTEVITIDLNGGDYAAHTDANDSVCTDGNDVVWRAYYVGTGKPMGSLRSANLPDSDEPNIPSTYAAGVWITDNVANHTYVTGAHQLMDDGFVKSGVGTDPCILIFAAATGDVNNRDGRAFGGTFDIYVYGATDGNFTLSTPVYDSNKHINGGYDGGLFVYGEDWTAFENVLIDDTNALTLSYDGTINAIQLIRKKPPVEIVGDDITIEAEDYDVAYETNKRGENDPCVTRLGADIGDYTTPDGNPTGVGYLNNDEYMIYDIIVDSDNDGTYYISAYVLTSQTDQDATMMMYLDDDICLGVLYKAYADTGTFDPTDKVKVQLFEGEHTLTWVSETDIYFDIDRFKLERLAGAPGDDPNFVNCDEVYQYHYDYENDFDGDCDVDANDLAYITENWLTCYSQDPNDC